MYGLTDRHLQIIGAFCSMHPEVEKAVLFGSRALGTYKQASDIDVALFGEQVTHGLAAALKSNVEGGSNIPYFVDFVVYPKIRNAALKEHIDRCGVEIWRRPPSQTPPP